MTEGAGTAVPCARGDAKGQAVIGYGPRRQIGVLPGRPGAPTRIEQLPAPGSGPRDGRAAPKRR